MQPLQPPVPCPAISPLSVFPLLFYPTVLSHMSIIGIISDNLITTFNRILVLRNILMCEKTILDLSPFKPVTTCSDNLE